MKRVERKIVNKILLHDLPSITPSLQIQAHHRGRKVVDVQMGESFTYYDLASLTKVIFTITALMRLYDQKKFELNDPVRDFLTWWRHRTAVVEVLTHSAGLEWWIPFHRRIKRQGTREQRREKLKKILAKSPVKKTKKAVYSDPDFWLLGFVLEQICQEPLEEIWRRMTNDINLNSLHFNTDNRPRYSRRLYAPTEDCPWRKKVLRGEVHDDNAWAMGGVAAHAGLFGKIEDVSQWGLQLRKAWLGESEKFCQMRTARLFTRRHTPRSRGDFGLGFWKPSRTGSSAGRYFGAQSYGHLGFTGTSVWVDPRKDLQVVILANRVHPTRENMKFRPFRAVLHDIIVESLGEL